MKALRRFGKDNPVIDAHCVFGQHVLPGLAYIDVLFQLFRKHGCDYRNLELRNVCIFHPLIVSAAQAAVLEIRCEERPRGQWQIVAEAPAPADAKSGITYLTAEMHEAPDASFDETIDMAAIAAAAQRTLDLEQVYADYRARALLHGDFMRPSGRLVLTDSALYVQCQLSECALPTAGYLMFHPALIDASALCSGAGVALERSRDEECNELLSLPLFYESFRASAFLQHACIARLRRATLRQRGQLSYCTLDFFDATGRKVAELRNLAGKQVANAAALNRSAQLHASPGFVSPPTSRVGAAAGGAALRSRAEIEHWLQQSIADRLQRSSQSIDPNSEFHELGINSAGLLELARALEQKIGSPLAPTLLFEYVTIARVAAHLSALAPASDARIQDNAAQSGLPTNESVTVLSGASAQLSQQATRSCDVAVLAIAGRFPEAASLEQFWENLREGRDCIKEVPAERWSCAEYFDPQRGRLGKTYCKWGGFIADADKFDPHFFSITRREAQLLDPKERLFLETVWNLFETANITRDCLQQEYEGRVGVYVGAMYQDRPVHAADTASTAVAAVGSYSSIANRVSHFFGLRGPSMAIDTMCSSSTMAVHLACEYLQTPGARLAIAGGVNLSMLPHKYIGLSQAQLVGSHFHSRSFSDGDGYLPAETVAALLLKPVRDAVRDGDRILAVIKATAVNHAGHGAGYGAPNLNAQAEVMAECLRRACVDAESVGYVEAAANGSALADAIEMAALRKVFAGRTAKCPLGSVKASIGHGEAASGMAQIAKVILQLQHRKIPPSLPAPARNPNLRIEETPFYLPAELQEWEPVRQGDRQSHHPRRALVNSFAAGGSSASVLVEEYTPSSVPAEPVEQRGPHIAVFSARDSAALRSIVENYLELAAANREVSLERIVFTLQLCREAMTSRLALVVQTHEELQHGLRRWLDAAASMVPTFHADLDECTGDIKMLMADVAGERFIADLAARGEAKQLALLWTQGCRIPWRSLYAERKVLPMQLPTYPFKGEQFGLARPANESARIALPTRLPDTRAVNLDGVGVYERLAAFIGAALQLEPGEIKAHKTFGSYGMDSLFMLKLTREIYERHGVRISGAELEQHPTLLRLAELIEQRRQDSAIDRACDTKNAMVAIDDRSSLHAEETDSSSGTSTNVLLLERFKRGELSLEEARSLLGTASAQSRQPAASRQVGTAIA